MQMLGFKFQQNHTINQQFDFFEGGGVASGRVKWPLFINFNLNYYWFIIFIENVVFQISSKSHDKWRI